jgi:hypothetical protein
MIEKAIHVDPFGDDAAHRAAARRGITVLDVEALRRDADARRARAAHPSAPVETDADA